MPPNRILFIKTGNFSFINDNIYKALHGAMHNTLIDVIDVGKIWKRGLPVYVYALNVFYFFKEYARDFIRGYKKRKDVISFFFATSYIARQTRKALQRKVQDKKYMFTLQTQSLFNGKIQKTPNFIYTDHTTRSNLLYPDIEPKEYLRSESFIENTEKDIYRDADMIFTCGSLPGYSLVHQYHIREDKVRTVFAGSNLEGRYVENPGKYTRRNLLFVGVEWERKGGPLALKVFERILQRYPDATLTIVGCTPENIRLPHCEVAGKVSPERIIDFYNRASIFFLPTRREPFGIVFLEAMYYRLPIIASHVGSLADMVSNGYNGFLVDQGEDEYVRRISQLFDNPEMAEEMGKNGYKRMSTQFTWDKVAMNMKDQIEHHLNLVL